MRAYLSVFRLRLINGMQYRMAAFAGVATQFFWGFMYLMIFEAFFFSSTNIQPISYSQTVSYTWLKQSFLIFIALWHRDGELFELITSGNIAYELCRPINLYNFWFSKLIAQRLSGAILRSAPILIIAFILPKPYRISLPPDIATFLIFLISLILGLFVVVSISMFIYISVFVTMSPVGSTLIFAVIGEFFAGMLIPIPFMPVWMQRIIYIFPFHLTCDMPFRIYCGHIPKNYALMGILVQIIWLVILILLGQVSMKKVLRKVIVQGG